MSASRKSPIRKLNPGLLQSDDEVREQFVVRQHKLAIVLGILRGNIEASSCQHVLVAAPRGRGKTMLLARVAAELHTDTFLSKHLLPIRFMEENQDIFNMADFWLETLFHLARESAVYNPELARELRETHTALTGRWGEKTLGERALAAVLRAADRLGKQLVLMVENLQALCDTVGDDFGWKLREVLQSEPQIILLATATRRFQGLTSRFKELDDAQQPFFELFRTVELEPLSTEECRELWRVISGDTVSKREMRPLEILTGGSPRLLVIVAGFGRHRSLVQLMEELVTLIDDHTEYFRSNMAVLPKTEGRVYIAVIDLWQPSTTGEVSMRARLDVRTVSTMLGRLIDRGAVISKGSGKKRQYVAAERLYSIYYKLRRERDEAAVVQNLIRFMVAFYSEAELAEMSGEFIAEDALHTCEELERRLDTLTDTEKIMFEWQVRCMRTKVLLVQENSQAAMEAFRSAYDVFVPANALMMSQMLYFVPDLIALGASVPDLVEILSSDKAKSDALEPLIVALREYATGEEVRAPEEVREVAADIIERIEQRIEARALKEGSSGRLAYQIGR